MRLKAFYITLAVLMLPALLLCGCKGNSASNSALPPIVATVNGRAIPTKLYEMYLKNGREELGIDPSTEEGRKKLDKLREGIVSELIDRALIVQEAERRGLSISPEKMTEAERRTVQQFGGDKKYDEYLAEHHLTRDEYRDVIKTEIYGEMMRAELSKDLAVSDEDIKKYYEEHKNDADMQISERVTASHILINARPSLISQQLQRDKNLGGDALTKAVSEEMERRRQRAEELRRKAASGADFAALARQSSDDPASRERGGDLGSFARNSHAQAFDDAAFALKPGEVSKVVQTEFGFHVIKLAAHDAARTQTLSEATPEIRRRLLGEREAERLTGWLKEVRGKATVHINEPFRFGALRQEFDKQG
jgi:parvulin-like peptidyl-prolyl isomerase